MSLRIFCSKCPRNCCEFLKKPKDYAIDDRCKHYDNGKCLLYNSDKWKERLKNGRTLLCELFPAVISTPIVKTEKIIINITANENCYKAREILNMDTERNKINEILDYSNKGLYCSH